MRILGLNYIFRKRQMAKLSKFKNYMSMTKPVKVINRFKKDEEGVTAVEFAIVGGPFFLLVFAIIESSLLFFANQYLETVVDDIARLYRTGQLANITTATGLRQEMCSRINGLFDCHRLFISLDTEDKFIDLPLPPIANDASNINSDGNFEPIERFDPNICPTQIVQLTASYEWPIYANYSAPLVSEGLNDNALIGVTAVVRTENFDQIPGTTC